MSSLTAARLNEIVRLIEYYRVINSEAQCRVDDKMEEAVRDLRKEALRLESLEQSSQCYISSLPQAPPSSLD